MKKDEKASSSLIRIILLSFIILIFSGIGVIGANLQVKSVKVLFANNTELNLLTTKQNVYEILKDYDIDIKDYERTIPSLDENVGEDLIIRVLSVKESVDENELTVDDIINRYGNLSEEIVTQEEEIPFKTITKDAGNGNDSRSKILVEGENGLREVTYLIRYKNGEEISREELESIIIKEPINKVVQINGLQTSREVINRVIWTQEASKEELELQVAGITPKVDVLNVSAYTASTCDKKESDPGYGVTASGVYAAAWVTVAAGKSYPMGTIIYIPYFKDAPNGGYFVVQDRGGAISDKKLDVYMDTYDACIQFGRKNLDCYIYEL